MSTHEKLGIGRHAKIASRTPSRSCSSAGWMNSCVLPGRTVLRITTVLNLPSFGSARPISSATRRTTARSRPPAAVLRRAHRDHDQFAGGHRLFDGVNSEAASRDCAANHLVEPGLRDGELPSAIAVVLCGSLSTPTTVWPSLASIRRYGADVSEADDANIHDLRKEQPGGICVRVVARRVINRERTQTHCAAIGTRSVWMPCDGRGVLPHNDRCQRVRIDPRL